MYIGTFDLAPETSANVFMSSTTDQSSRNRIKYFTHYKNSIFFRLLWQIYRNLDTSYYFAKELEDSQ